MGRKRKPHEERKPEDYREAAEDSLELAKVLAGHERSFLRQRWGMDVFRRQASNETNVAFTVGVASKSVAGDVPIAWGNAVLIVKDREAGGRFLQLFSKAFPGKMPASVKKPHVPRPLFVKTAILGEHLDREAKGGFSGKEGGWTATKWFPEHDGRSGEVYFNYNVAKRQGEFSEKDADYA